MNFVSGLTVDLIISNPDTQKHKVHIYLEYHSVYPRRWNWDPPPPFLPLASVPLPPEPKGGGGLTRLRVRGWRSPNSNDWHSVYSVHRRYGTNFLLHHLIILNSGSMFRLFTWVLLPMRPSWPERFLTSTRFPSVPIPGSTTETYRKMLKGQFQKITKMGTKT